MGLRTVDGVCLEGDATLFSRNNLLMLILLGCDVINDLKSMDD